MNNNEDIIGAIVNHKKYGLGKIYKITEKNVFVKFERKQRRFRYPEAFENKYLILQERKKHVVPMPDYPDIVPIHPELTMEELRKRIDEEVENAKQYTEWPDI